MSAAIAEIPFLYLPVESPRKKVVNRTVSHVVANGGVTVVQYLPSKLRGAFSTVCARKVQILPENEITRVSRDNVEELRLRLGVTELHEQFDLIARDVHKLRISAVISRCSSTRRRLGTS